MQSAIPNTSFFEFTFRSPKRVTPIWIDGRLDDWSTPNRVPDLMHLKGMEPFAEVYLSWDDDNLYVGLHVTGKTRRVDVDATRFWQKDCLEVWIDLRNDKSRRRYSEHCHHFFILPRGRKGHKERATAGECREAGAAIQETIYDHKEIEVACIVKRREYALEARISRGVIPTYDPVHHPMIGFNYHLNDVDRRAQWWSCGPDFPRHVDPSTWGSVQLVANTD